MAMVADTPTYRDGVEEERQQLELTNPTPYTRPTALLFQTLPIQCDIFSYTSILTISFDEHADLIV